MVIKPLDSLITLTAEELNISEDIVKDVVYFKFRWLKEYLNNPIYPNFHDRAFGTFHVLHQQTRMRIGQFIRKLRMDRTNKAKIRKFRILWRIRHLAKESYKIKRIKHNPYRNNDTRQLSSSGTEGHSDTACSL